MPSLKKPSSRQATPTSLVQVWAQIYPIILLSALAFRFDALVQDPISTMSRSLPLLAILQTSTLQSLYPPRFKSVIATLNSNLVPLVLALGVGTPVMTVLMILLGAPITTHLLHTSLTAAHIALLALLPLVYVHGLDPGKWKSVLAGKQPLDGPYGTTVGTFVGAWLGAVPIPLDWDREWQRWPVTIVTGVYVGYAGGAYLGRFFKSGKGKNRVLPRTSILDTAVNQPIGVFATPSNSEYMMRTSRRARETSKYFDNTPVNASSLVENDTLTRHTRSFARQLRQNFSLANSGSPPYSGAAGIKSTLDTSLNLTASGTEKDEEEDGASISSELSSVQSFDAGDWKPDWAIMDTVESSTAVNAAKVKAEVEEEVEDDMKVDTPAGRSVAKNATKRVAERSKAVRTTRTTRGQTAAVEQTIKLEETEAVSNEYTPTTSSTTKKRARRTVKVIQTAKKRKTSTRANMGDIDMEDILVPTPPRWREMYDTMKAMREKIVAPVDTMGCERLADVEVSPRTQRFQTLIALMLSSQTKDTSTAQAMTNLQLHLPSPAGFTLEGILSVPPTRLNELIHPVGFHNTKTRHIQLTAAILREKFKGDIPDTIEGLMSLPGVGPKMAYLTMSAAWGRTEGIGVDVHVHRITNLWRWHRIPVLSSASSNEYAGGSSASSDVEYDVEDDDDEGDGKVKESHVSSRQRSSRKRRNPGKPDGKRNQGSKARSEVKAEDEDEVEVEQKNQRGDEEGSDTKEEQEEQEETDTKKMTQKKKTKKIKWKQIQTSTPEQTRKSLESWLPHELWHEINHLLVGFGQTVCLPVGRKCKDCDLGGRGRGLCPSSLV